MPTKPQPKTLQQKQDERRAALDWYQQMEAYHAAERYERERGQREFEQRVAARRDQIDSYIRRSWAQRSNDQLTPAQLQALRAEIEQEALEQTRQTIPSIAEIYAAKAAEEQAAAEAAEAARIAALTPRQIWLSTLDYSEQARISKWEAINKMSYPMPADFADPRQAPVGQQALINAITGKH